MPIFRLEKLNDAEIKIEHIEEGHHFTFLFAEDNNGRRVLSLNNSRSGGHAKHDANHFADEAWRFAESEARKRAKID